MCLLDLLWLLFRLIRISWLMVLWECLRGFSLLYSSGGDLLSRRSSLWKSCLASVTWGAFSSLGDLNICMSCSFWSCFVFLTRSYSITFSFSSSALWRADFRLFWIELVLFLASSYFSLGPLTSLKQNFFDLSKSTSSFPNSSPNILNCPLRHSSSSSFGSPSVFSRVLKKLFTFSIPHSLKLMLLLFLIMMISRIFRANMIFPFKSSSLLISSPHLQGRLRLTLTSQRRLPPEDQILILLSRLQVQQFLCLRLTNKRQVMSSWWALNLRVWLGQMQEMGEWLWMSRILKSFLPYSEMKLSLTCLSGLQFNRVEMCFWMFLPVKRLARLISYTTPFLTATTSLQSPLLLSLSKLVSNRKCVGHSSNSNTATNSILNEQLSGLISSTTLTLFWLSPITSIEYPLMKQKAVGSALFLREISPNSLQYSQSQMQTDFSWNPPTAIKL